MDLKKSQSHLFLSCESCKDTYNVPRNSEIENNSHICPICNFQTLQIVSSVKNTRYTICPYCYSHPPSFNDIENISNSLSTLPCFSCMHPTCPLATGVGNNSSASSVVPCKLC